MKRAGKPARPLRGFSQVDRVGHGGRLGKPLWHDLGDGSLDFRRVRDDLALPPLCAQQPSGGKPKTAQTISEDRQTTEQDMVSPPVTGLPVRRHRLDAAALVRLPSRHFLQDGAASCPQCSKSKAIGQNQPIGRTLPWQRTLSKDRLSTTKSFVAAHAGLRFVRGEGDAGEFD